MSFIAKNIEDFKRGIKKGQPYTMQEYIIGTRYYMHFFHSPITERGYRLSKGSLEMLGIDRRDESNIDEMYKLGAQEALREMGDILRDKLKSGVVVLGAVIDERLAEHARDPDDVVSRDEVLAEARRG